MKVFYWVGPEGTTYFSASIFSCLCWKDWSLWFNNCFAFIYYYLLGFYVLSRIDRLVIEEGIVIIYFWIVLGTIPTPPIPPISIEPDDK